MWLSSLGGLLALIIVGALGGFATEAAGGLVGGLGGAAIGGASVGFGDDEYYKYHHLYNYNFLDDYFD